MIKKNYNRAEREHKEKKRKIIIIVEHNKE